MPFLIASHRIGFFFIFNSSSMLFFFLYVPSLPCLFLLLLNNKILFLNELTDIKTIQGKDGGSFSESAKTRTKSFCECDGECFKHIFVMFKSRIRRPKINYSKINSRWIQLKERDKSLKMLGEK